MLDIIVAKTGLSQSVVKSVIDLLEEGNTVPFIARYRKEMTGGATDTQLRIFEEVYSYQKNLAERKADILRLLEEKEVLTPELKKAVEEALTLAKLEDIYRPFKDKKNTRATKAIAKGLQPLADILLEAKLSTEDFEAKADEFIALTGDPKTEVATREEAIQGAQDIVAEIVSDDPRLRELVKEKETTQCVLQTKKGKQYDPNGVYATYESYHKVLESVPSYAYLAVCRAEKEKQLSVSVHFDEERARGQAFSLFVPKKAESSKVYLEAAIVDGCKRLLFPSLERELRSAKKEDSDRLAIAVFGKNVQELLLSSPVRGKVILGFDPAYRTGCKLAVLDAMGKFLYNTVIYPTEPQKKIAESAEIIKDIVEKYKVGLICIGNGTGSRESEAFVAETIKKYALPCKYIIVSESGASVYSASSLAEKEYPNLDVTVRGAISIGHRVQDPMAAYVKIDPKSLGVGQYQHDVDQKLLAEQLDKNIEDAVNRVGVDVNTASSALLQHIAGLSKTMADNVVAHREENGPFTSRPQIKKVKGIGPKAYEQAVGFLRIIDAKEPLDSTGIHPETYKVTYELLEKECGVKKKDVSLWAGMTFLLTPLLQGEGNLSIVAEKYDIGEETLADILRELQNPGLDPREDLDETSFKSDVLTIEDLKEGMEVTGVVRNIVDFWAFVDIGVKNDALVHKSQMADYFVADPFEVLSVWQQVKAKVLSVDLEKKKVSITMKESWNGEKGWKAGMQAKGATSPVRSQKVVRAPRLEKKVEESSIGGNISFS